MAGEAEGRIGRFRTVVILALVFVILAAALAASLLLGGPQGPQTKSSTKRPRSIASLEKLYNTGEFKAVAPKLADFVKENPDNVDARSMLASSYWLSGMANEAREAYEALLEVAPDHADTWYRLGILLGQSGQAEAAARHLERAIKLRPDSALFHTELAKAYVKLEKFNKAISSWGKALDVYDNARARANALAELGNTFVLMDKLEEARNAYENGLKAQPDHEYLKQQLDRL